MAEFTSQEMPDKEGLGDRDAGGRTVLEILGPGEGVDGLSLGVLVAAPIAANLILGALSRQREYQADLEAVALTDDPAALARAIELIEMAQKRIASSAFPGAVRIRLPRLLSSHPDPNDRIRRLRQLVAEEEPPSSDERIAIPDLSRTSGSRRRHFPSDLEAGHHRLD